MEKKFVCQVCNSNKWKTIEKFIFRRSDHEAPLTGRIPSLLRKLGIVGQRLVLARPRKKLVCCKTLNAYQISRRKILFDIWAQDFESFEFETIFCVDCGFATLTPRPEECDVLAKYHRLKEVDPDIGGESGHDAMAMEMDQKRANRVFAETTPLLPSRKLRILDYGGGNGKLLRPFLEAGHECYLIDFNEKSLPGVTKIGNNINDLSTSERFDLILCSHVLEHVSNLAGLVSSFGNRLNHDGLFFCEVPQQIWAGIFVEADPVTHINFFTMNSLRNLLYQNGFEVVKSHKGISSYGKNYLEVLQVLGRARIGSDVFSFDNDIQNSLYPSRKETIRKLFYTSVLPKIKIWTNNISYRCLSK